MEPHFNAERFLVMDVNAPGAMRQLRELLICDRLNFLLRARSRPVADAPVVPAKMVGASRRDRVVEVRATERRD